MNYVLENEGEAKRLEKQSRLELYDINKELDSFQYNFKESYKILDAGCGSGILCRELQKRNSNISISGCDQSVQRIQYAQLQDKNLEFFEQDLTTLSHGQKKYNAIFNRFVAHHMNVETYTKVLEEFSKSLLPNGQIYIIDLDGVLLNLGTTNPELRIMLNKIQETFHGDLTIGRKIPQLLKKVGFKNINWKIETMDFQGKHRQAEVSQFVERFDFAMEMYLNIFRSEFEAKRFQKMFLEELSDPNTVLFYNKFLINASI